jgi:hypothetical protein
VGDLDAVRRHLESLGYRTERVRRGTRIGLEAEGIEPLVLWPASSAPGLVRDELETMMDALYGRSWQTTTRLRRR